MKKKIYFEKQIGIYDWTGKQKQQPSFQCHILFLFRLAPPFFFFNKFEIVLKRAQQIISLGEIEWKKSRKSMVQVSYLPSTSYIYVIYAT